MKYFSISAALLALVARADEAQISADLEAGATQAQAENPGNRNVELILGDSINAIKNYGCWCYFGDDHGAGRGAPIDSVDATCKNLHMGYDCAMMDVASATGVDDCVPWDVPYASGVSFGMGALVDTCNSVNDNLCAQYACMIEGAFVTNIIQAFLSFGSVNPDHLHSNGFDIRASCPVNGGDQTDERQCCGLLPYRYPYKPIDRECCGASTYDPSIMDCCNDDVPRFSCVDDVPQGGPYPIKAQVSIGPEGDSDDTSGCHGTVYFEQFSAGQTRATYVLANCFPEGDHGFHVHAEWNENETGCVARAGGHYDPHGVGDINSEMYITNMGLAPTDSNGAGQGFAVEDFLRLEGDTSVVGRSVVIHEGPGGARIACGGPITVVSDFDQGYPALA